jgi:hypothetical protein
MAVTAFYQQDKAVLKLYLPLTQEAHQQIGIATSTPFSWNVSRETNVRMI